MTAAVTTCISSSIATLASDASIMSGGATNERSRTTTAIPMNQRHAAAVRLRKLAASDDGSPGRS
jgi:hypothetical protein